MERNCTSKGDKRKYLTREPRCVIMESMKRIDVLKGIRQILVQKAYETGHISHRADGDWQKQADGSWKPYTGQSTPQAQKPTENTEYGEITEEDLVETPEEDSNDWEEEDTEGYYGNSGGLRSTIYEGAYDTQISNIGNTEEDDYGNSAPNDEAVENVVRGIMQEWTGDTDDEDAVEAVHDGLKDAVLDRWSSIYVQKSAVRDMRSTLAIKNMGL